MSLMMISLLMMRSLLNVSEVLIHLYGSSVNLTIVQIYGILLVDFHLGSLGVLQQSQLRFRFGP